MFHGHLKSFILIALSLVAGYFLNGVVSPRAQAEPALSVLRLSGYKYVSPLLTCDTTNTPTSPELDQLKAKLLKVITNSQQAGAVTTVSLYFRSFTTGASFSLNPDAKFNPASLIKVPMMIAAFQKAQSDPDFLTQSFTYEDPEDHNATQELKPAEILTPGRTYTLDDAVAKLIRSSDNNA